MKLLWILMSIATVVRSQSPAILWPADQFQLKDGHSALTTMNAAEIQDLFNNKNMIVFHRRNLNLEDVAYPSKPLHYLQGMEVITLQSVKEPQEMLSSLKNSSSAKLFQLKDDKSLADQDQFIKDTMNDHPGFAAILIGSGSASNRVKRDAPTAKNNPWGPACQLAESSEASLECLIYIEAVKKYSPEGKPSEAACTISCAKEGSITVSVMEKSNEVVSIEMKKDGLGHNVTVAFGHYKLDSGSNWVPEGYSYSCSDLRAHPTSNNTDKSVYSFEGLQMFPKANVTQFPESFDCETWFTPPLLMGTSIALFYIILLFVAVLLLLDVKTNDRFDDPKGKTITVNVSE